MGSRLFLCLQRKSIGEQLETKIHWIVAAYVNDMQRSDDSRARQMDGVDIRELASRRRAQTAPIFIQVTQGVTPRGQGFEPEETPLDVVARAVGGEVDKPRAHEGDRLRHALGRGRIKHRLARGIKRDRPPRWTPRPSMAAPVRRGRPAPVALPPRCGAPITPGGMLESR